MHAKKSSKPSKPMEMKAGKSKNPADAIASSMKRESEEKRNPKGKK